MGLFTMVEENLRIPFSTIVLGIQVSVDRSNSMTPGDCCRLFQRPREAEDPITGPFPSISST